jgi:hypothetical protein
MLAPQILGLLAQIQMVCLNHFLVRDRVMTVFKPILNQMDVVSHTASIHPNPVCTFDPNAIQAIPLQGAWADFEGQRRIFSANKVKH